MTYASDAKTPLIALEESLAAIERAAASGEWNEIAAHEVVLAENWRLLTENLGRSAISAEKHQLETLLKRTRALSAQLAARKAQIGPLIDAFVPADSTTLPPP